MAELIMRVAETLESVTAGLCGVLIKKRNVCIRSQTYSPHPFCSNSREKSTLSVLSLGATECTMYRETWN